jgi:hypothetical protein
VVAGSGKLELSPFGKAKAVRPGGVLLGYQYFPLCVRSWQQQQQQQAVGDGHKKDPVASERHSGLSCRQGRLTEGSDRIYIGAGRTDMASEHRSSDPRINGPEVRRLR